ncbi:unnamed protein product [Pieris macdunnoughi]|uniref:Uncharacterized protein n=1 Tax=Pieris macdunnoughi TaxID=345717 RepID=A0A821Q7F5_9NEOP|nr:unnamed protein product [Pieris macdunnoughi]
MSKSPIPLMTAVVIATHELVSTETPRVCLLLFPGVQLPSRRLSTALLLVLGDPQGSLAQERSEGVPPSFSSRWLPVSRRATASWQILLLGYVAAIHLEI